jgi:nucleoside permease NupC
LTRGEGMTGGMAGIAGPVLVLYATVLGAAIPDAAGHLVVASVLGAPVAVLISLIMVRGGPALSSSPRAVFKAAQIERHRAMFRT